MINVIATNLLNLIGLMNVCDSMFITHVTIMFRCQVGGKFAEQRRTIGSQLQRSLGNCLWWFIWLPWRWCCLQ